MQNAPLNSGPNAFGDGSHPTTAGVLAAIKAMDPQAFCPRSAMDVGAGSGILSLAIREKFGCPVIASDIERSAVDTIRANAVVVGCADDITALQADGFDHPDIRAAAPFDLMAMNILAEPLRALAVDAVAHLASEGVLILSGILLWQEESIGEAYRGQGLEMTFRVAIGDWVTLVFQKE